MTSATPATLAARRAGLSFTLHDYDYDPAADRISMAAAEALGEPPARVLKTLMVTADGKPACVVLPSDAQVAMKRLATALSAKAAAMMPPADAERLTGFRVGGISPFGQKRPVPTVVEAAALAEPYVFVNGGVRGLQMRLAPADLVATLRATVAAVVG